MESFFTNLLDESLDGKFEGLGMRLVTCGDQDGRQWVMIRGKMIHYTLPHWGSQVYELESACVSFVGREGSRKIEKKKGYFYRVSAFRPAPSSE